MFKSITKTLVFALLVFAVTVGATSAPSLLAAHVSNPLPTSPNGNALITTDSPTLKWSTSTPASVLDHYEYEVSQDSGFSIIAVSGNIPAGTQEDSIGPLTRSRTYFWRVRACDTTALCTGWSTTSFRISINAPTLVAPADLSVLLTNRDTLDWNSVPNASGYAIQISTSSLFSTFLVQTDVPVTQTEFTPTADLPINQILFWRVRAKNSTYGPGPWSEVWSFLTANPPSTITLLQPKDKKMTTDHSPRLVWSEVSIPSGTNFSYYQVQVDTHTDFSATVIDDTTVTDKHTPYFDIPDGAPLDPATTYYWRVRACNDDGINSYCNVWPAYFTLYTSLDSPSLISPGDGDFLPSNRPIFDWTDVVKTNGYTIQVARNPFFTSLVFSTRAGTSQYQPVTPLPAGVTLYWRVRGERLTYGPGLWSSVFSFTTAKPPLRPVLKSPISGILTTTTTPTLVWSFSSTPIGTSFDYYQIQIDVDPAFSAPIEDQQIINQYTPYFLNLDYTGPLSPLARYYWRVRACSVDIAAHSFCSEWSAVWNFRVAAEAPINLDATAFPLLDWDDVVGASSYLVEIRKSGILVRTYTAYFTSQVMGSLPAGTYNWRVRVKSTYVPGYAPGAWSATDTFVVP